MTSVYEDISLWHERDISHSSVERVALPDAIMLSEYMLKRMNNIVKNLIVYPNRMLKNIYLTNGVIFSQRVMSELIKKDLSREEAYDLVQVLAQKSYTEDISFIELVENDSKITSILSKKEIEKLFDLSYYLNSVEEIYHRVGLD